MYDDLWARCFQCLGWLLQSLAEFGNYSGEVAIFSDRPAEQTSGYVPRPLKDKVKVKAPAGGFAARYAISEQDMSVYSPVLYLDTDVIVNTDINPVAAGEGICVTTERGSEHTSRCAIDAALLVPGSHFLRRRKVSYASLGKRGKRNPAR